MTLTNSVRCAFSEARLDLFQDDTVKVICRLNGETFFLFVKMDVFFQWFALHKNVPCPLPGLRWYPRQQGVGIRFEFDQETFIEECFADSRQRLSGGAYEVWVNLLRH